jgi:hypothetical protein
MPELTDLLADGRDISGEVLIDTGTLTRDTDGQSDATFNATTLRATVPADGDPVWSGPCLITPEGSTGQPVAPGAVRRTGRLRVLLPYTAPVPQVGDYWTATTSQDPSLVDARMRVDEIVQSTALVFRTFYVMPVVP